MITCIIGTRAQLVKMAPVISIIEQRQLPFQIIMTGQHKNTMQTLLDDFEIKTIPKSLEAPQEISSVPRMLFWFPRVLFKMLWSRNLFKSKSNEPSWILIHGDTLSTLLGAIVGKFTSCKVAHVESGLRSNHIFSPFPEEITRLMTFYLADVGFAPGEWAIKNLQKFPINAVNTEENTIIDSVRYAITHKPDDLNIPRESFGIVTIHRFENIYKKSRFIDILSAIDNISNKYMLLFVLHPATEKRLKKLGLFDEILKNKNIKLMPRMGYISFINLSSHASFVVTDGGSNQEELSYLNIPTLIMRKETERPDGLGRLARLNGFKLEVFEEFFSSIDTKKNADILNEKGNDVSPSKIIVDYLAE